MESQQADREQAAEKVPAVSAEEKARHARLATLNLARARAEADLATARNPAHRAMLEAALKALDEQIARLV